MSEQEKRPIVIRRVKKVVGGGHHGGAWKVAYADFVTAMMAFFLVLWLMSSRSQPERAAISQYFRNPSTLTGKSTVASPGMNGPGGASTSMIKLGGTTDLSRGNGDAPFQQKSAATDANNRERQRLEALKVELHEAIEKSQALEPFKDQLLLDLTPEGLRIQIVDKQNRPMFDMGRAKLMPYARDILLELTHFLNEVPNRISITGHTDTTLYATQHGYSNWELSADRANAARRTLVEGGMADDKMAKVVGLSSSVLFDRQTPTNPINRRISIVVMTQAAESAARAGLGQDVVQGPPLPDAEMQMPQAPAAPTP